MWQTETGTKPAAPPMKKTSLTAEEEDLLREWRDHCLRMGMSTAPADRATAEAAITEMYRIIGRSAPRFVWTASPLEALLSIGWLITQGSLESSLGDSLVDSLATSLRTSVVGRLRASRFYGQHELYWPAFYEFCAMIGVPYRVEDARRLRLWMDAARSAGWWWPYENAVIISDRPALLHMEQMPWRPDVYRLHCATGPALAFRDGYSLYALHGIGVPAVAVEHPERLTAASVIAERNSEVRRVLLAQMGNERFLRDAQAMIVHQDQWGILWRCDLKDTAGQPYQFVQVINSTPEPDGHRKDYFLRVSPSVRTAHEAIASTFRLRPEQYHPAVQT